MPVIGKRAIMDGSSTSRASLTPNREEYFEAVELFINAFLGTYRGTH
jgi:hypothetical protein